MAFYDTRGGLENIPHVRRVEAAPRRAPEHDVDIGRADALATVCRDRLGAELRREQHGGDRALLQALEEQRQTPPRRLRVAWLATPLDLRGHPGEPAVQLRERHGTLLQGAIGLR